MGNFTLHHYSADKIKKSPAIRGGFGMCTKCRPLAYVPGYPKLKALTEFWSETGEVSSLFCKDLELQFYTAHGRTATSLPVAQAGWFSRTWSHSLKQATDAGTVLGLWNLYGVAFHLHELVSVFVSCWGQGWFFKHCFCGSPVPPALLLLMAGKVSFGMCGGWHIWSRRSFYSKPRVFFFFFGTMRKNQNESFQEVWSTLGITLSEAGQSIGLVC